MCFGGKKKEEKKEEVDVEQEEQKVEVEEKKETEAKKVQEVKEKAMEEKIATVTAPVSTMEPDAPAKRRQEETKVNIEAPEPVEEPMAMEAMADTPEGSLIKKRKQKQSDLISGLSKKRSKGRGRRSLITSQSGGGIGYYSRFFTQDRL